jgi:WD40 repeat protein/transcriptional regulator with XRE-family HTH domain
VAQKYGLHAGAERRPVSESFSDLVLRHRGRARLTQRELASSSGVGLRTVQDWEAGNNYPTEERLKRLIRAFLDAGGLSPGREVEDAQALWDAVAHTSRRMRSSFDKAWFARVLAEGSAFASIRDQRAVSSAERTTHGGITDQRQDWGEAPDTADFVGRTDDLALLRGWVLDEGCRLISLLGMGGVGKTSLAARLAHEVAPNFEHIYWRSLRDAPPVSDWLEAAIGFLSDQQMVAPAADSERLAALLQLLRDRRSLAVLDNCETLLQPGQEQASYREAMVGYGRLVRAVGEASHQSCMVLTSREALPELSSVGGGAVRDYRLGGLGADDARVLLGPRELAGSIEQWTELNERYAGNALALKLVSDSIREIFGGEIGGFLEQAGPINVFGGIRRLVGEQVDRSSLPEQHVLRVLAVEREPVNLKRLIAALGPSVGSAAGLEAVEALRRRSLIERAETAGPAFTLQSVVLEYVTDQLVADVVDDVGRGDTARMAEQMLIRPQAKDYLRQAQERVIGMPILERLTNHYGTDGTEARLLALLHRWRDRPAAEQGYGPGDAVNLLRLLRGHLRGLDLSRLSIRRAYLAEVEAQDSTLAGAHLAETVLAEGFDFPGSVALSADGATLAVGTSTGQVWLWRVVDRTPLVALLGPTGAIWALAISADGHLVASGSTDGVVRLWDTSTGRAVASLEGHTGMLRSVTLSADGQLVASGGSDGTVRLWDTSTGRPVANLEGHSGGIRSVIMSADGRLLASVGTDGLVRLWETRTGRELQRLQGRIRAVRTAALSADGQLFASGGTDGLVGLWETSTATLVATLRGQIDEVWGLALSADGHLLASGGIGGIVQLWDTATAQRVATLQGLPGGVWGLSMSADGQLLASGGTDGAVRLWETGSGRPLATLQGHIGAIRSVALANDGRLVAGVGTDGLVRLWETASGKLLAALEGNAGEIWGVSISADNRMLASGGSDGIVRVWEVATGRQIANLDGHIGGIRSVTLSADGRLLASGGTDASVRVWDTVTGSPVATLRGHAGDVRSVALSADGHLLVSGGADRTVRLWETATAQLTATLEGHGGEVWSVTCAADGHTLASGGIDGTVRIWDGRSLNPVATLHGQTGGVLGVALAASRPDLIAIGGSDGTVRIWDTTSLQPVATLTGHTGGVPGVAFSADGCLLATGSFDGTVKLWDLGSCACLRTLRRERRYERLDITGVTGITEGQRQALIALGALDRRP